MKVALLTRVSTSEQADSDRHSIAYQAELMREMAERKGWDVVATWEIPGESAYRWYPAERPQFSAVIDAAKRKQFDILVIYDITRFARNQAVLHETRRTLRECGVQLWVYAGDYDAVADGLRAGIEGAIAEQSSVDQSRKIRHAYDRRHRLGLPTGDTPFGYRRGDGTDSPPLVVPEEAEAIHCAFVEFATGRGFLSIAIEWNRAGLKPRSKRGLAAFSAASLQSIIENRFYTGVVIHNGHEAPGRHQPIITEAEWQAANGRIKHRVAHHTPTYKALLAGLVSCAACSGPVWSHSLGGRDRYYYFEPSLQRGGKCEASGKLWRSTAPDAIVADTIKGLSLDDGWMKFLSAMPVSEAQRLEDVSVQLNSMAEAWELWTLPERHNACALVFQDIRMDMLRKDLFLKPRPEFTPYFEARQRFASLAYSARHCVLPPAYIPWEQFESRKRIA